MSSFPTSKLAEWRTYEWLDNVENLERYRTGGFYPVELGDEVHNKRYRIIQKLGYGSYSTVWLARDTQRNSFVSLKFLCAEDSHQTSEAEILRHLGANSDHPGRQFVLTLLDQFEIQSVNGTHRCLVTEALGPSVGRMKEVAVNYTYRLPLSVSKRVATQFAKGVAYIHSRGVVHGGMYGFT
jgi:serine/threonine-protein kinase SRPK3